MTSFPRPRGATDGLYRIYDPALRLLYAGISDNPLFRTQAHRNRAPWWCLAETWSVEWFASRAEAASAEMHAVRREGALYNSDYNELFRSSAIEARRAIPAHLERKPIEWETYRRIPAPMPYRIDYVDWHGGVARLKFSQAAAWAAHLVAGYPEHAEVFAGEADGVPDRWRSHAVVAYAVRLGVVGLEDLAAKPRAAE